MHVNVPVALSFVCAAPFSEAAGETSEAQLGMQKRLGGPALALLSFLLLV